MLPLNQKINLSIIKEIVGEDQQALLAVLQEFADTAQLDMNLIVQAYAINDLQTVADVAHKLRSTFRYFGTDQIERLLAELELAARQSVAKQTKENDALQSLIDNILIFNELILSEVKSIIQNQSE